MNLTNKKRIFDILFCSFLFFIVLSTDKVYAYEERACEYKDIHGNILIVQQDSTGVSRVRGSKDYTYQMKDLGLLDSGCPSFLTEVLYTDGAGRQHIEYQLKEEVDILTSAFDAFYEFTREVSTTVEHDPNDNPEVNSCEDLIGEEVIGVIQEIFNWIRIAIPIIIIVMTIIDFSKSLFMDEESMKKSQKKFIKRLIIGIVIFFIPTLVMGILELINKIAEWNWIKAGICGLK